MMSMTGTPNASNRKEACLWQPRRSFSSSSKGLVGAALVVVQEGLLVWAALVVLRLVFLASVALRLVPLASVAHGRARSLLQGMKLNKPKN